MSRSLRWKFIFVIMVLILLLMTVVCVFLIQGVQSFYTNQFFDQMDNVFTDPEMSSALQNALDEPDPAGKLAETMKIWQGRLGLDGATRDYYILSGTGELIEDSRTDKSAAVEITPNILKALNGGGGYVRDAHASYMDVAVPVADSGGAVQYIIEIRDNKQTVRDLSGELVTLILEAVAVGLAVSVVMSFLLAKTLLQPIIGMTKAAEAISEGDFSKKLAVESDDEIGILADTFNNMATQLKTTLEEIKKSEALRREFVANVSHELRTPLTSIRSYAETLTETGDIPKEMESDFLHVILNESDRMTKIVQDLLELSRFDAGNLQLTVERFSPERSVLSVCDAIALEARKHGHRITADLSEDMPEICGDKARIEQVLLNILSNAVKYTPDGGEISITGGSSTGSTGSTTGKAGGTPIGNANGDTVSSSTGRTGAAGDSVWIKIRDTGIGIPEEDLNRIFDRFYRVDKARSRESGGTGLGLSIAREIVLRHGGDIRLESTVGRGTTVTVVLPVEGPNRDQA